jgi:hypothetical protein
MCLERQLIFVFRSSARDLHAGPPDRLECAALPEGDFRSRQAQRIQHLFCALEQNDAELVGHQTLSLAKWIGLRQALSQ